MKIYSIYKFTNRLNCKCYIGFDSSIPSRFNQHKRNYNKPSSPHYDSHFHRALRAHGWDNFTYEVIYQSLDGEDTLKRMEGEFIKEYDSFLNGYNMTLGGEGTLGYKYTEEQILENSKRGKEFWEKASEEFKASHADKTREQWNTMTEEQKESLKEGMRQRMRGNKHALGMTYVASEEQKRKISLAKKGKKMSEEHKQNFIAGRTGKGMGERNSMSRQDIREKQKAACAGRRRAYREDGSWYWVRPELVTGG